MKEGGCILRTRMGRSWFFDTSWSKSISLDRWVDEMLDN